MNLATQQPSLASEVFVAPSAAIIGNVSLGHKASVWYGCVLKGDEGRITVGSHTNLQDGTVVRSATSNLGSQVSDTMIGSNVTIGHNCTLRSCSIADASLVGMDSTILEGVQVESGALVAAGSVVQPHTTVPAGQVWGGNPARYIRDLKPNEKSFMHKSAEAYCALGSDHVKSNR
ncbi:hypothetical protein ABBQ38_000733 [Trebouxia sp. C0009 RCD-2024]